MVWTATSDEIKSLKSLYVFKDKESEIIDFINESKSPFLIPTLLEIPSEVEKYFPNSKIILKLFTDPGFICGTKLVIKIKTDLSPGKALMQLERFDEDWWLERTDQVEEILCIDV